MELLSREYLQGLREEARSAAKAALNPGWIRALEDLAQAANVIDAFIARSEVHEDIVGIAMNMESSEFMPPPPNKIEQASGA